MLPSLVSPFAPLLLQWALTDHVPNQDRNPEMNAPEMSMFASITNNCCKVHLFQLARVAIPPDCFYSLRRLPLPLALPQANTNSLVSRLERGSPLYQIVNARL